MSKSFAAAVLAVALASPALLHAQSLDQKEQATAAHPLVSQLRRLDDLAGSGAGTAATPRVWAYVPGDQRRDDAGRTAIDHRFAPDGLVGSAGYLCHGGYPLLDSREETMAVSSRFSPQDSFLGAKLSYAFK